MDYNQYDYGSAPSWRQEEYDVSGFLSRTYRWMFLGLLATFGVAFAGYYTGAVLYLFRFRFLTLALPIAELALVIWLSARLDKMSASRAVGVFFAYAVLNGVTFSVYFLLFELNSMIFAFAAAALYFGIMAMYGARTSRDLSGWGPMLMAGLIALVICGFLGMFIGFGRLDIVYCGIGLVIFMGLTAYDVQKIKRFCYQVEPGSEMAEKISIYGALSLYLDFINIFLYILRLLGRRSNN